MTRTVQAHLFSWLACHLVAISLFGFLLAGLCVFRILTCPDIAFWPDAESRTTGAPDGFRLPVDEFAPAASERLAPRESMSPRADDSAVPRPAAGRNPRFIGGTIPIYGFRSGEANSAFRPGPGAPGATADSTGKALAPSRDDYLQRARRAFWEGDFEAAEAVYVGMIGQFPEDADAFGELGNLYQRLGRRNEAREALFEAGLRLKLAGDTARLKQVTEFLEKEGDPRVGRLRH